MARIRSTGNTGRIKFKKNLGMSWVVEALESETSLVGSEGDFLCALTFGDPYTSDVRGPIFIKDQQFVYHYNTNACDLESSTGRIHKIASGPFFKTNQELPSEIIRSLTSLGSWVPNLPAGEHLNLTINNLVIDNVYQIRCIFLDGKNKTSPELILNPGDHQINYNPPTGIVAVGTFTASKDNLVVQIKSKTSAPPHLNSVVLRKIDYRPSVILSQLKMISNSKA